MSRRHIIASVAVLLSLAATRALAATPESAIESHRSAVEAISWPSLPVVQNTYYDYDRAMKVIDDNRVVITLKAGEGEIFPGDLRAVIQGQKLESTNTTEVWNTTPRPVEGGYQIVIADLDPATVYRFRVCLFEGDRVIGKMPYWYFAATTSADDVDQARAEIIMSAFREWNAFNYRRVNPGRYGGGAWCSNFYRFVAASRLENLGPPGTHGGYGLDNHFRTAGAMTNTSQLIEHGGHGDYIRMPGHTAMLIAYDHDANIIWTIEGNYSNSIRIKQRRLSTGWSLGCITESQLCEECRLLPIQ